MIDGREERKRQLAFELQSSRVCEKRTDLTTGRKSSLSGRRKKGRGRGREKSVKAGKRKGRNAPMQKRRS